MGQGKSEQEAIENMKAEVETLFGYCSERDTLAELLAYRSSKYSPPAAILQDVRIGKIEQFTEDEPDWATVPIDPAIIDQISDVHQKTGKS